MKSTPPPLSRTYEILSKLSNLIKDDFPIYNLNTISILNKCCKHYLFSELCKKDCIVFKYKNNLFSVFYFTELTWKMKRECMNLCNIAKNTD